MLIKNHNLRSNIGLVLLLGFFALCWAAFIIAFVPLLIIGSVSVIAGFVSIQASMAWMSATLEDLEGVIDRFTTWVGNWIDKPLRPKPEKIEEFEPAQRTYWDLHY